MMTSNASVSPLNGEAGKLTQATQRLDISVRWHCYNKTIKKQAFAVIWTIMMHWTVVSHIPFKNTKPFINIPPMDVTTDLVTFMQSSGAGQFFINLVDGLLKRLRWWIPGVASTQAAMLGKAKPFRSSWQCICRISVILILSPASMDQEISPSDHICSIPLGVIDTGRPNLILLRTVDSQFSKAIPGKMDWTCPTENVHGMMHNQIVAGLRFRAPIVA